MSGSDSTVLQKFVSNVDNLLIRVTFRLWDDIDDRDEAAKINAALKSRRQLKRTANATEEVLHMLSTIDLANPPKELDNYIDKRHKKQVSNLRRELKNEFQKTFGRPQKPTVDAQR